MLTTQTLSPMPFMDLRSFLKGIVDSFESLHGLLELGDVESLPYALRLAQGTLNRIYEYPQGPTKLKEDLRRYPQEQQEELFSLLDSALVSHQQNVSLIESSMQRNIAEQASAIAQNASSATYGRYGAVSEPLGTVMSHSA